MIRRLVTLVVLAWLSACAAPVAPPSGPVPPSVSAAEVKVGDYWEYSVRDGYTRLPRGTYRYEVTRSDASGVAVDVKHEGRLIDAFFYAPGWNPREMPLTNVQRFRYSGQPFPAYPYPLEPGKSWYTIVDALDPATGRTHRVHVQGKVIGWERIRVPAGEFDVLRVRRFVYADNAVFFQSQEEIIQTDWYAPSVRRVVREEGTSSHVDRSRSDGGGEDGHPLLVKGDWLIAELVGYSAR
jgi:hypothetical protein